MVPVPGRSTHSKVWFWQVKQNGWGGSTNVPHVVHLGATSRPSAAASQKGCVHASAKGSFIKEGKVPRTRSVMVSVPFLVVARSVVQQPAPDRQPGRSPGDDRHLGVHNLVHRHTPELFDS